MIRRRKGKVMIEKDLKILTCSICGEPLKAIQKHCLECSGGDPEETRQCPLEDCPLHSYRTLEISKFSVRFISSRFREDMVQKQKIEVAQHAETLTERDKELVHDVLRMSKTHIRKDFPYTDSWKTIRFRVLQRDNFACQYCGRNPIDNHVKLHVDHIYPHSRGGTDDMDNLITACEDCNEGKNTTVLMNERSIKQRLNHRRDKIEPNSTKGYKEKMSRL